jgi:hypothetical protein
MAFLPGRSWGQGYWQPSGSNIYYNSGNVGIGTASPSVKAEVANGGYPYNLYLSGLAPSLYLGGASGVFPNGGAGQTSAAYMGLATAAGDYGMGAGDLIISTQSWQAGNSNAIRFGTPSSDLGNYGFPMSILRNGNVGIGTTAPGAPLDIENAGYSSDQLRLGAGTAYYSIGRNGNTGLLDFSGNQTGFIGYTFSGGNVGIGTTNPQRLLHVAGIIGAEEVIVSATGADYVFQPGYHLQPLKDVQAYISENHHLPDIPSAVEVREKGVNLGEMQSKLLAKVEELTLHMIQADERNNRLEQQNRELQQRIARLEAAGSDSVNSVR